MMHHSYAVSHIPRVRVPSSDAVGVKQLKSWFFSSRSFFTLEDSRFVSGSLNTIKFRLRQKKI